MRYSWPHAGDLLHVDSKKLGRIEGVGKRSGGPRRYTGIGWDDAHVAMDDATRLAYAEELPDEPGRRPRPSSEALYLAADAARTSDPTLAARYHRLMVAGDRCHSAALCSITAVLPTRIAASLRDGPLDGLRDVDRRANSVAAGRAICARPYAVSLAIRAARGSLRRPQELEGRDERVQTRLAARSKTAPVPRTAGITIAIASRVDNA